MKNFTIIFIFLLSVYSYAQVGIGTVNPSSAAMLEISGRTTGGEYKGFLPPRVETSANQASILPDATDIGLTVFVEETGCLDFWNGTAWENIYCTGGAADVWINEFHYDDTGNGANPFIEIAGPAGTDVSGYYIVKYNGLDGEAYGTIITFAGVIDNEQNGYGAVSATTNTFQKGNDGFALVGPDGKVIEFLSYEGPVGFTAVNGPAVGITSTDIGVSEGNATPVDASLHLVGTGTSSAEFTWAVSTVNTSGSINTGQNF